jgi:hypothetical protein
MHVFLDHTPHEIIKQILVHPRIELLKERSNCDQTQNDADVLDFLDQLTCDWFYDLLTVAVLEEEQEGSSIRDSR